MIENAEASTEIWARPIADGAMAFAMLNIDEEEKIVSIPFARLGMRGRWKVRDLWRQKDEGIFADAYSSSVPGHATHLVKLMPVEDAGLKPCLRDIRDNSWRLPFDAAHKPVRALPCPCE